MPKDTELQDHKAEALRLLNYAQSEGSDEAAPGMHALAHAALAIAEGQDRVAEALLDGRDDSDLAEHLIAYCKRWIDHHAKEAAEAVSTATRESHEAAGEAFTDVLKEVGGA